MRVVACGLTTLDLTQEVEALPGANQKVIARTTRLDVGGPAANAARAAAALGSEVTLITALGAPDGPGQMARQILHDAGVQVVDLSRDDEAAALPVSTALVTPDGQRAVASTNATALTAWREVDPGEVWSAKALLVDGHLQAQQRHLAAAARAAQVPVILDGGSWKDGLEVLLERVDFAVLSGDFTVPDALAQHWPGDTLEVVAAMGPQWVAQSHGGQPIEVRGPAKRCQVDVEQVEAIDTLGAGDVLHGALAHWVAAGKPMVEALSEASRVASRSVRYRGAMGWARAADEHTPD